MCKLLSLTHHNRQTLKNRNMSLEYARKLARRWESDEIPASGYYYQMARKCLRLFSDHLTSSEHSLLAGLVEYYNHHR